MNKQAREALDAYYVEADSWGKDRQEALRVSRRTAWIVAWCAAAVAVMEAIALVADIDKHALAHITVGSDSSGDGDFPAFGVGGFRGGAGFGGGEFVFEGIDAFGAQGRQLGLALLDQRIGLVHSHRSGR